VILSYLFIYKTNYGLKIRASGEYPAAASSMGINIYFTRYVCVILGGMFAGLGGTFLVLDLGVFVDNMTGGRGFVALACVIFGRWKPFYVMAGALIFGIADAFQLRLQALGYNFPHELLLTMPYVLTIIILTLVASMKKYNRNA
jgi:simple sugar transport system permease protein